MRIVRAALAAVNYITSAIADATYLALEGGTLSGTLTVPDGTAAAPGVRTTSEAHGLFRSSATALGLATAGVEAVKFSVSSTTIPSGALYTWLGRSKISSSSDGTVTLQNAAATGFTALLLGGATSAFPALKRNGTELHARLADDSAYTTVCATRFQYDGGGTLVTDGEATPCGIFRNAGSPEGVITAAGGSLCLDTTNSTAWLKANPTGNTGWVEIATL